MKIYRLTNNLAWIPGEGLIKLAQFKDLPPDQLNELQQILENDTIDALAEELKVARSTVARVRTKAGLTIPYKRAKNYRRKEAA